MNQRQVKTSTRDASNQTATACTGTQVASIPGDVIFQGGKPPPPPQTTLEPTVDGTGPSDTTAIA